jgi:hypothetical protein
MKHYRALHTSEGLNVPSNSTHEVATPGLGSKQCATITYLLTPWSRALLDKLTVNFAASQ